MNIVHFKEHKVVEKEESSSYLSRFWCLDNVAHHTSPSQITTQGTLNSLRKCIWKGRFDLPPTQYTTRFKSEKAFPWLIADLVNHSSKAPISVSPSTRITPSAKSSPARSLDLFNSFSSLFCLSQLELPKPYTSVSLLLFCIRRTLRKSSAVVGSMWAEW